MLPSEGKPELPPQPIYSFTSNDAAPTIRPQAKLALRRISTLAGLLRLEMDPASVAPDGAAVRKDPKFKQALSDLMTVSGPVFPDWNPKEFLDTAEMTHAVAIGYDWL